MKNIREKEKNSSEQMKNCLGIVRTVCRDSISSLPRYIAAPRHKRNPACTFGACRRGFYKVAGQAGLLPNALVGVVAPHVGLLFLVGEAFGGIYAALARADTRRCSEQSFCVEGVDAQRGGLICLFHDSFCFGGYFTKYFLPFLI